jgi:hypothetical protein
MAVTTQSEPTKPLEPSDEATTSLPQLDSSSTIKDESTKKRDTFDPYKYGKIQFTTKFFRKIIAEQLPEVPSEDLFRAEDLAQKSESARRGTYPPAGIPVAPLGVRKAFLLPLIALGVFVVVGAGIWAFSRGNEATSVAPPALASAQVSAPSTAPAAVTQEAPAVSASVATAPVPATSAASSQGPSEVTVSGSGVGKVAKAGASTPTKPVGNGTSKGAPAGAPASSSGGKAWIGMK